MKSSILAILCCALGGCAGNAPDEASSSSAITQKSSQGSVTLQNGSASIGTVAQTCSGPRVSETIAFSTPQTIEPGTYYLEYLAANGKDETTCSIAVSKVGVYTTLTGTSSVCFPDGAIVTMYHDVDPYDTLDVLDGSGTMVDSMN